MDGDNHFITVIHKMGAQGVIQAQLLAAETHLLFLHQ